MTLRPIFGDRPGAIGTPNWVRDAIFYRINPDRFARSDRAVKPEGLEPWDTDPTDHGYNGGDLLGIVDHLDYLVDLGVTAILLRPVFQSTSNSRYAPHDFFQVDPLLGGNHAIAELIESCHAREIRIVLEGVFSHCGRGSYQFTDVLEHGEHSPWRDWFTIQDLPLNAFDDVGEPNYAVVDGRRDSPRLNTANPLVREFLMQVGEFWLNLGIDGWMIRAPHEVESPDFWSEFRARMKAINPDALICSEIGVDTLPYFRSDEFDSGVNHVFAEQAFAFSRGDSAAGPALDAHSWADAVEAHLARDDWNVTTAHLNPIHNDATKRGRQLAALLTFAYPGAPAILYGEEVGLRGDLRERRAFPWDGLSWDLETREYYQRLIRLRRWFSSLRSGTWQVADLVDRAMAIVRRHADDGTLIVVNTGELLNTVRVDGVRPVLNQLTIGETVTVRTTGVGAEVSIPPRSAAVFSVRDA
jgi:glycosidase